MEALIYKLLAYMNNSLDKDINYHIAKRLLENLDKIEGFSLETAAEACSVAPSTINRFCKKIGFRNFSNLRNMIVNKYSACLEKTDSNLNAYGFIAQLKENVEIIENIPGEQIERVIKQINESRRIVILSFEKHQLQAMELQKKLLLTGKFCECDTNLFKQMDALDELTEEDLVITISIQGYILSEEFFLEKITRTIGKKLLITFSKSHQHQDVFDEILLCGKIENTAVSSETLLRLFDVMFQQVPSPTYLRA